MRPSRLLFVLVLLAGSAVASAQPSRTGGGRTGDANDRLVADALAGFGIDVRRGGAAWDAVPGAFRALYPNERYERAALTAVQARAVAFTAMAFASGPFASEAPRPGPFDPEPTLPPPPTAADARGLAFAFLAAVPTGSGALNGAARDRLVQQGTDAAGVAGAVGCAPLATALGNVVRDVRSMGYSPFLVDDAQRAAGACR